jgi:hypothetical protein
MAQVFYCPQRTDHALQARKGNIKGRALLARPSAFYSMLALNSSGDLGLRYAGAMSKAVLQPV